MQTRNNQRPLEKWLTENPIFSGYTIHLESGFTTQLPGGLSYHEKDWCKERMPWLGESTIRKFCRWESKSVGCFMGHHDSCSFYVGEGRDEIKVRLYARI